MQKASPGEFHDGSLRLSRKTRLDAQYLVRPVSSLNGGKPDTEPDIAE
jgi:hypothetical protein